MSETVELSNEMIATEIMGWKNDPLGGWLYEVEKDIWVWAGFLSVEPSFYEFEGYEYQKPDKLVGTEIFDPLHDMNHCAMAEKEIFKDGLDSILAASYVLNLFKIVLGHEMPYETCYTEIGALLNSTPEQRCRAMLLAKGANLK